MKTSISILAVAALLILSGCSERVSTVEEDSVDEVKAPIGLTVPLDRWESGVKELGGAILDVRTEAETGGWNDRRSS